MLEKILSGQSWISTNGSCWSSQNYSSTPNDRATYPFLLRSFHFSLSSFSLLSSQISQAHFSRKSVLNLSRKSVLDEPVGDGPFGDTISEIGISNIARNSSGEADLLKRRKAQRLKKNESTGLSILSKEPPTSYNLFHTHEGANSHD